MTEAWWTFSSPWIHSIKREDLAALIEQAPPHVSIFQLNGSAMRNPGNLFTEFASKLSFPRYFGRNWAALEDCLHDMTWLPAAGGYLLVINDWRSVLSESQADRPVLSRILNDVGSSWAQYPGSGVPFNALLVNEESNA